VSSFGNLRKEINMWKGKEFNILVAVILFLFMTTLQACHTMKFEIENIAHEKLVEDTHWFFVEGLFPTRDIDVSLKCPSGAAAIKEQTTFGNGFISVISIGIVTPRSVWYYCLPAKSLETKPVVLQLKEGSL
jgi:hypothetical protein